MKILVVCQYFYPEEFKVNELVEGLVKRGNEVTVLTGKPTYPRGPYPKGYKFWGVQKDLMYIKDSSNGSIGAYYLRFNQTHDSLHITKIYLDHGHEDSPSYEQGGDIPVEAIDRNLRFLGLNALPEHFKKEAINDNRMIISTEKLRLKFKKF